MILSVMPMLVFTKISFSTKFQVRSDGPKIGWGPKF